MQVFEGEFVISRGVVMERLFMQDGEVCGCQVFMSENEEYFIDRKGFELLKDRTGLKTSGAGGFVHCTYADTGEPEVSGPAWENAFGRYPGASGDSGAWINEYLKLNRPDRLNRKETDGLARKMTGGRQ